MGQNMKPSQILKMFPRKGWAIRTLQRVVGKIKYGEETIPGRRPGRDRPVQDPTLVAKASALFKFRWGYDKPWGGPACPKARLYEEAGPVRGKKLNLKSVAKVKGSRMSEKNRTDRKNFADYALMRMGAVRNPMRLETIWFPTKKLSPPNPDGKGRATTAYLYQNVFMRRIVISIRSFIFS